MAEQYLDENQQEELKQGLYAYLRDKAARRAKTGNSRTFEGMEKQFQDQEKLYDAGALVGGLSEAASMVGSVGGKRAESNIIPALNKSLYDSRQNLFKNNAAMRDMEEKSLQTDMDIARYLTGLDAQKSVLDTAELQRQRLRQDLIRRKLEPRLRSKSGLPVMVDEVGTPSELPGYAYNEKSMSQQQSNWQPYPGVVGVDPSVVYEKDQFGNTRTRQLPKGFQTPNQLTEAQNKNYVWGNRALEAVGKLEDLEKDYKVGWKRHIAGSQVAQALTGNLMKDETQQQHDILSANVIDPILRTDTGAAMGREEVLRNLMQYQVVMGDSDENVRLKQLGRRNFIKSIIEGAGVRGSAELREKYQQLPPLDEKNYPGSGSIEAKIKRRQELLKKQQEGK